MTGIKLRKTPNSDSSSLQNQTIYLKLPLRITFLIPFFIPSLSTLDAINYGIREINWSRHYIAFSRPSWFEKIFLSQQSNS